MSRTVEGSLVGNVVDQQDAHGAAVVGGRDGAEALLAGRVPDLQLGALSVQLNGADLEVDADGRDKRRRERVLAEAQQAARLADARVANEEQFDLFCVDPTVSTLSPTLYAALRFAILVRFAGPYSLVLSSRLAATPTSLSHHHRGAKRGTGLRDQRAQRGTGARPQGTPTRKS